MKRVISGVLAVLVAGLVSSGCYNTYQVPGAELHKLNGYREGQTVQLTANDGRPVPFSHRSSLDIQANDGQGLRAKFSAVTVQGNTMSGVVRGSGAPVNVDLSQVAGAEVKNFAVGKTIGLSVGLGVGVPAVIITAVYIALFVTAARALSVK